MQNGKQHSLDLSVISACCNVQERLGNLTNKCMDGGANDVEYFVQESAHILGLQEHAHDAKVMPVYSVPVQSVKRSV